MRHRISIVRGPSDLPGTSGGTQDAYGAFSGSDVTVLTGWARINPVSGREQLEADRMNSTVTHRVYLRPQTGKDVRPNYRVVYGTRTFNIVSVIDTQERGELLELMCEEEIKP